MVLFTLAIPASSFADPCSAISDRTRYKQCLKDLPQKKLDVRDAISKLRSVLPEFTSHTKGAVASSAYTYGSYFYNMYFVNGKTKVGRICTVGVQFAPNSEFSCSRTGKNILQKEPVYEVRVFEATTTNDVSVVLTSAEINSDQCSTSKTCHVSTEDGLRYGAEITHYSTASDQVSVQVDERQYKGWRCENRSEYSLDVVQNPKNKRELTVTASENRYDCCKQISNKQAECTITL